MRVIILAVCLSFFSGLQKADGQCVKQRVNGHEFCLPLNWQLAQRSGVELLIIEPTVAPFVKKFRDNVSIVRSNRLAVGVNISNYRNQALKNATRLFSAVGPTRVWNERVRAVEYACFEYETTLGGIQVIMTQYVAMLAKEIYEINCMGKKNSFIDAKHAMINLITNSPFLQNQ